MTTPGIKILILCGPTGVGKTELSLQVAERFSCEIIGVDSMQVYRYMDIGTAKPTDAERERVAHHLVDFVDPDQDYTLGTFVRDADIAIRTINSNGKIPLLVGGTGLYIKGLLTGVFDEEKTFLQENSGIDILDRETVREKLKKRVAEEGSAALHEELSRVDPDSAARVHPNDTQRIIRGLEIYQVTGKPWSEHLAKQPGQQQRYQSLKIGLTRPREKLYERIDRRVQQMVDQGLLAEVKNLLAMGYTKELKSMQSIGYRHMINYIEGNWDWEQTLELLARDTRHYAKRQYTWFNNDPEIRWHKVTDAEIIFQEIKDFLTRGTGNNCLKS